MSQPTAPPRASLHPIRWEGDRRQALVLDRRRSEAAATFVERARVEASRAREHEDALLSLAFVEGTEDEAAQIFADLGFRSLGQAPLVVRPLRWGALPLPLVLPFGNRRRVGVREISARDPRLTRLWDRFSIDVVASIERNAAWLNPRVFGETDGEAPKYRVFVFEDGDRYVIRALCIFRMSPGEGGQVGEIAELLHDRSVAGMRAASHLLGLALRELAGAGAREVHAWSLVHSGSYPIFARHAFWSTPAPRVHVGVASFDLAWDDASSRREHWYLSLLDRA